MNECEVSDFTRATCSSSEVINGAKCLITVSGRKRIVMSEYDLVQKGSLKLKGAAGGGIKKYVI